MMNKLKKVLAVSAIGGNSSSYVYTAVSLVSGQGSTFNHGARFTKYHQQFYLGNSHIVYVDNTQ